MNIISNGSKWAGESPAPLSELIDTLKTETLEPSFEKYGRFFYRTGENEFRAWGNFRTISHVFMVMGTLDELRPLALALKQARRRPEYLRIARPFIKSA